VNRLFVISFVVAAGCSDDPVALTLPDHGCLQTDQVASITSSQLAPAVRGSLAGWDPVGRWFLTGTPVRGVSSVLYQRSGDGVIMDRNSFSASTFDDTQLFVQLEDVDSAGNRRQITTRVTNLQPDGTARIERAVCNGSCEICTATLVRATHNANEGEGEGLTLLSEVPTTGWAPGYTLNVRVDGTLAYLIRQHDLRIIETADPAHPVEVGHYQRTDQGYSNDVKLVDVGDKRYAVIADSPVDVVDVTDPAAPVLVANIPEGAHTVFTETRNGATLAYFGGYDGTCPVYDVTDPTHPRMLGRYNAGASLVHDLSIADGIAYLNAWEAGFMVVDFTTPSTPRRLGAWTPTPTRTSHSNWTTTVGARHIALHGEESYNAHLNIVDIDPKSSTFMQPIASWQTRPWISIHNIMVFGNKSYLTHYQDGVRVLSVADPEHPVQIGYYNTWDPDADYASSAFFESAVGLDVDFARKLIFVADAPRGLLILRDDTPEI
jgi:hypothetical protein